MRHRSADSPKFYSAIEMMDDQIRRLWEAIQYRQKEFGEEWQIFVTTDHGRDSVTGRGHGGQSTRERSGWIVTNAKGLNEYFKKGTSSIADIMPTIAALDIKIPKEQLMEIDGQRLTGKLSAINLAASFRDNHLYLTWKPLIKKGMATISVAITNNFKTGGRDNYRFITRVPVIAGKLMIDASSFPATFYKVVIEMPDNMLTRWVIVDPSKK